MTPDIALVALFLIEIDRANLRHEAAWYAAQIEQESAWRPTAASKYAKGLAQFTPPTWGDIAPLTDPSCVDKPETDPACSVRAQLLYMERLKRSVAKVDAPRLQAFRAYNGGLGWLRREQRRCAEKPRCNPYSYQDLLDVCVRADWACRENQEYPGRIAAKEPKYRALTED